MSMELLLLGVRNRVRTNLSYADETCEIMPDGQPPARCGEVFVAVHAGELTLDNPLDEAWEGSYAVSLTLSLKAGRVPQDQAGVSLVALAGTGLLARAKALAVSVHGSYTVLATVATALGGAAQHFVEPLRLRSVGRPQAKPPSWFWSDASQKVAAGWAIQIDFYAAKRYEVLPGPGEF